MVSIKEIKSTIAVAIAAAFGFIIALIWKDIIIGAMKLGKLWQDGGFADVNALIVGIVVGVVITLVSVLGIIYISKWGGVGQK
jgi:biotin transporter BioY